MRFRLIAEEKANYPVVVLCEVLQVRRSGFYAWLKREPSARARSNTAARVHIRTVYRRHKGRYGYPRIYRELQGQGMRVGRHRIARLMRLEGLRGTSKRRFRLTTNSKHGHPIAPNRLRRRFKARRPNQVWLSDITYIPTTEGFLYLSCFLDLYSRRIVGWAIDETLEAAATCKALLRASAHRLPPRGLTVHSDRGVQYAGGDFQRLLRQRGYVCSMSRKGNCWDNAPMESFFGTLKRELPLQKPWTNKQAAEADIAAYLTYYNQERRHSALGYLSPLVYEAKLLSKPLSTEPG